MSDNKPRKPLPGKFEKKYQSEQLKELIADEDQWIMHPPFRPMEGAYGVRRIKANDLLFTFIDRYLGDMDYAFEPGMDGMFICLPYYVIHQGIGLRVNREDPSRLEICELWYPGEYSGKNIMMPMMQKYSPMYLLPDDRTDEVTGKIREYFALRPKSFPDDNYCTFSFALDHCVMLEEHFLDNLPQT